MKSHDRIKWISFAVALVAAAALASGCGKRAAHEPRAEAAPVSVAVLKVGESVAAGGLVLPGRVKAREEVTVTALTGARLTSLPVPAGGRFERGAALAVFDAPEAQRSLEAARAALRAAETRLAQAELQETRMDSLFAARVASQRELEMAQSEHRAAAAAHASAEASLAMWTTNTSIPAPFAGVVVRHRIDPGATVGPGQPLLDIRSLGGREIEVPVPESEVESVRGARAEYQVGESRWRAARVLRMDGMIDYGTRTRMAYLAPAGEGALEPGAYARVRFVPDEAVAARGRTSDSLGARAGAVPVGVAILVPDSSVVRRGALAGVFVIREGHAELRWLKLGRATNGSVEVLAGLRSGEEVALHPAGLIDGQPAAAAR